MVKEIKAVFLGFCIHDKKELPPQGEKLQNMASVTIKRFM